VVHYNTIFYLYPAPPLVSGIITTTSTRKEKEEEEEEQDLISTLSVLSI
jgi:hypothetical protein